MPGIDNVPFPKMLPCEKNNVGTLTAPFLIKSVRCQWKEYVKLTELIYGDDIQHRTNQEGKIYTVASSTFLRFPITVVRTATNILTHCFIGSRPATPSEPEPKHIP